MALLLDVLFTVLALAALLPAAYLVFLTVNSWRLPAPSYSLPKLRFDIVVPAHNEEGGIGRTVTNLLALDYPKELFRVLVVADNCNDATADRAREAGAEVLVRFSDTQKGKGYALHHAFEHSLKGGKADAVVVVDADTLVSPNLLKAFAHRLEGGALAVQAHYAVLEQQSSWRTRLMRMAFALFHGVRSQARERLGVSCGLRGNGMCFSHALIREVPHDAFSVVEDVEYGIRIGRKGHAVRYAHEAEVFGEMVAGEKASRSQRERWEGGRLQLMKQYGLPLLQEGFTQRSPLLLDLAADVLVPPFMYLVGGVTLGLGLTTVGSVLTQQAWLSAGLFALSFVLLGLYALRGWQVSGVGLRGLIDMAFAPLYLVWKLKLLISRPAAKKGEWVRTTREKSGP